MSKRINPSINALSTLVIVLITAALTVVNVIPVIREKQGKSGAALGKRGIAVCMAVVVAITGVGIAMLRKGGGKVHRGGGLCHASLLVDDCDYLRHLMIQLLC